MKNKENDKKRPKYMLKAAEYGLTEAEESQESGGASARCDLAVEARELYLGARRGETRGNNKDAEAEKEDIGVEMETEKAEEYIEITRVKVVDERGEKNIGKPKGNYITIETPARFFGEQSAYEGMCRACAKEIKALADNFLESEDDTVLVVGLGNWNITADALGPKAVASLMVTRHLKEYVPEEIDEGVRPVCAISPGVLGLTGVETGEIVLGIVDRIKPKLVIAIDALCSRRIERINATIQIADTGITPGEGVGNKRRALNLETLGIPVIAIGVPTVVDAATIAGDTLELVVSELESAVERDEPLYKLLSLLKNEDRYELIRQVIGPKFGNFVVAPKEVDSIIDDIASVVANGINIALHSGIELEDIDRYV